MRDAYPRRPGPLRRWIGALFGGARARIDGVDLLHDVPYGGHPAQRMDVYRRPGPAAQPMLLMVHGGAWASGDKARPGVVDAKVAHWLPRGWIFISINYRLLPDAAPLAQADDVARALAQAQRLAPGWGGDPARCVLMGHSSGAHVAALAAADPSVFARHGVANLASIVLLDSAALDVVALMQDRPRAFHRRAFGDDPEQWRAVSALQQLTQAPAPTLLLCSEFRPDSVAQARSYASRCQALGGRAEAVALPLRHVELNRSVGEPGRATELIDAFFGSLGLP